VKIRMKIKMKIILLVSDYNIQSDNDSVDCKSDKIPSIHAHKAGLIKSMALELKRQS
jgi:hypothetical protein